MNQKLITIEDNLGDSLQDFRNLLKCGVKSGVALQEKILKLDSPLHQISIDHKKLEARQSDLLIKYLMFSSLATSVVIFINIHFFELNFKDLLWMGDDRITNFLGLISPLSLLYVLKISPKLFPRFERNFIELQMFLEDYFHVSIFNKNSSSKLNHEIKKLSRYSGESNLKNLENANLGYLQKKIVSNQNQLAKFEDMGAILELLLYSPSVLIILRLFYLILQNHPL